ncbi:DegT/DnrJ/EryC1/StrS family aminotransferase [Spongiivirga sp. MCCC 1A20706]|uniref:DegT/DnrJ/EryC1/StrS family aminotransferase n=1 Tax=Spongiivirga sp. MCCC 1A20706 TaxID=3160963 RepID=UPI0039774C38
MPGFEFFGEEERKQVNDVLDNGVLMRYGFDGMRNGHWKAKELEASLRNVMKVQHAQLTSSGTSALTVALAAAGVGAGDEVIMPTFTFVASFESIIAIGAVPVLVDIDDTLTLDPQAVKNAITAKTRVIMPVHMCGSMAQLKELKQICNDHNLILLEDACQAIGGTYDDKPLGSYGHLGCFSFDFVKTITCGEGGAVITNNKEYYLNSDHYTDHGHDHVGNDRGAESHPFLGYNYRISELNAAVGLAQIEKLPRFLELQKQHYLILKNELAKVDGVTFRRIPEAGVPNYGFLNFFLPNENAARNAHKALGENGVDACFYWYDNNWHYIKKWDHLKNLKSLGRLPQEIKTQLPDYHKQDFSKSDHWMGRTISSLIKLSWTEEEVTARANKMAEVVSHFV